ncbi:MAG TPA: amidohydrolase family protein [Cyclobacteriaceae bacterium]
MVIDAHQHFWKFDPVRDSWITDDMSVIQKDFLPEHLKLILQSNGVSGCVAVQADQSETENEFLISHSKQNDFVKGIVGWVNLEADNIEDRLAYYKSFDKMKGFRHILQGEKQRDFMLRYNFKRGISKLKDFNFTYDILIFPDQLKYTTEFVSLFPDQKFVIDHIAKPEIKAKKIEDWKKDIQAVAKHENVHCKISGMITEADWKNWSANDINPYLDVVVEAFGIKRILYGSDWPVCLVAGSYTEMLNVVRNYFSSFTKNEQEMFFGQNAIKFYNL